MNLAGGLGFHYPIGGFGNITLDYAFIYRFNVAEGTGNDHRISLGWTAEPRGIEKTDAEKRKDELKDSLKAKTKAGEMKPAVGEVKKDGAADLEKMRQGGKKSDNSLDVIKNKEESTIDLESIKSKKQADVEGELPQGEKGSIDDINKYKTK
jgi:hypothetical protein